MKRAARRGDDLTWIASREAAGKRLAAECAESTIARVRGYVELSPILADVEPLPGRAARERIAAAGALLLDCLPLLWDRMGLMHPGDFKAVERFLSRASRVTTDPDVKAAYEHQAKFRDRASRFAFAVAAWAKATRTRAWPARRLLAAAVAWGYESARRSGDAQGRLLAKWEKLAQRAQERIGRETEPRPEATGTAMPRGGIRRVTVEEALRIEPDRSKWGRVEVE